ncbi:hypothetical protein ACVIGB_001807 [Bradyrhizobium sp. USDA 4341]
MSRYPHLAFQTLKAADLRINAREAGWHMVGARPTIASHISIAICLRQNSYVDAPAAWALQVYGPSIARDHGSILPRWSDVDQASVSSFAMITLTVGLIVATDETLQLRRQTTTATKQSRRNSVTMTGGTIQSVKRRPDNAHAPSSPRRERSLPSVTDRGRVGSTVIRHGTRILFE